MPGMIVKMRLDDDAELKAELLRVAREIAKGFVRQDFAAVLERELQKKMVLVTHSPLDSLVRDWFQRQTVTTAGALFDMAQKAVQAAAVIMVEKRIDKAVELEIERMVELKAEAAVQKAFKKLMSGM